MSELPIFSSVEAEEQAGQLRSFLKELGADISEKSQGLDQDAFDLVKACPILATLESETEVEMVLNSLMSLILILPKNSVEKVVKDFCSTLTADDSAFAPVKFGGPVIRVLSNLFHGFGGIGTEADERRHLQFDIYCTMLKVAARSNLVRQVPTDLTTVKQWMTDWKLDTEQRRYCLRLLHTMLVKGQQSELGNKVMLELLATYTVDDAASAEADATACIRTAISDPGQFIFDHLLSLSPVKQLSGSKIHHLLNIFVTGVLQDYLKFYSENKDFVENLPLNMRQTCSKCAC